jgi:hypothetical protein
LLSGGGELLAEVAEAEFGGAKQLAVGGIDEGVGHLLQQGSGGSLELLQEAVASLVAGFSALGSRRRG